MEIHIANFASDDFIYDRERITMNKVAIATENKNRADGDEKKSVSYRLRRDYHRIGKIFRRWKKCQRWKISNHFFTQLRRCIFRLICSFDLLLPTRKPIINSTYYSDVQIVQHIWRLFKLFDVGIRRKSTNCVDNQSTWTHLFFLHASESLTINSMLLSSRFLSCHMSRRVFVIYVCLRVENRKWRKYGANGETDDMTSENLLFFRMNHNKLIGRSPPQRITKIDLATDLERMRNIGLVPRRHHYNFETIFDR